MNNLFSQLKNSFGTPSLENEEGVVQDTVETEGVDDSAVVEADETVEATETETTEVETSTSEAVQETEIIDSTETDTQLDTMTEGIDTADEVVEAVENLRYTLESFLETGGIDVKSRIMLGHAMEAHAARLGYKWEQGNLGSLESFDDVNNRYDATIASMEGISDFLTNVKEKISAGVSKAYQLVSQKLNEWLSTVKAMKEKVTALEGKISEISEVKQGNITGSFAEALYFDGKLNLPVAAAKRANDVLSLVQRNWKPKNKIDAIEAALSKAKQEGETIVIKETSVAEIYNNQTVFKEQISGDELSRMTKMLKLKAFKKNENLKLTASPELPGGYRIVERNYGGYHETNSENSEASEKHLFNNKIALVQLKNYKAEAKSSEVPVGKPGDLKMVLKVVGTMLDNIVSIRNNISELKLENRKAKIDALIDKIKSMSGRIKSSASNGYNNLKSRFGKKDDVPEGDIATENEGGGETSGEQKVARFVQAVMVGMTHIPDVGKCAISVGTRTSKALLQYVEASINFHNASPKTDETPTE